MASRPVAAVLKRTSRLPASFFTSPAARQTKFLNPRYFTSRNVAPPHPSLHRPLPISGLLTAFRRTSALKPRQLHTFARRPYSSTATSSTTHQQLTVSQRMKQLFKEYGFSAIGVYFLLSVLDFPFCFLFVKTVGTEKIAYYEHIIIEKFWSVMPESIREWRPKAVKEAKAQAEAEEMGIGGDIDSLAHGEGLKSNGATGKEGDSGASLWTMLLLAYAVHKSLIFIRVPLTAAVTPKIVQKLRGWGFNIGQKGGVRKGVQDARANFKERSKSRKGRKDADDDD
ncbi:hypothetical protein ABW19_dt0202717 [Dactylella cylindrospora]|nr:hypothetical protein ABW19_dt0202717 [Dactylella cylindrospora]